MRKLSRSDNGVKLRIDDDDDLWTLARICRDGTSAGMLSHRRDSTTGTQEGGRSKQAERKPMWIVLRVEESSFQPFTDNLRLHGVISEAPIDVGSYHTHTIEPGSEIELSWEGGIDPRDLQLIEAAVADGQRSRVGLIVVENDEILLFEVAKHGIRDISSFSMRGGGKRGKDSSAVRSDFYLRVAKEACLVFESSMPVVICGPGLARERFETEVRESCGIVKILNVATSIGGRAAANEVISEGLADALLGEYAVVHEVRAIEEALKRVSVEGAVAYGIKEIQMSAEQGAVECLIIEASHLREENHIATWGLISDAVTAGGGTIIQASVDHDAGKQLMGFGGALALLRWRV